MNDTTGEPMAIFRTRDFVGWAVVDQEGDKIGTVADLLIDGQGKVRYVDAEFGFPRKQHVLLPQHRLEWGERRFILAGLTQEMARSLPPYEPDRALDAPLLQEMSRAYPWVYERQADEWRQPQGDGRVVPISQAKDFRLEKGAPDLRSWNVFGSDGERVGPVTQVLVDPAALKVRYLDVDLHDDLFLLRDDRHVLVPLEHVELKERGNDAWVQGLTAAEVARLPAYSGGTVSLALEAAVQRAWEGQGREPRRLQEEREDSVFDPPDR